MLGGMDASLHTEQGSASCGTRRWTSDSVVWAMTAVFPVVRLLEAVTSRPVTYPDTKTYRTGKFLDFSLTSLDGRSLRPWGASVWMALWPSNWAMVVGQVVLSVLAWIALTLTVAAAIQRPALRRAIVLLLLVLASTAQVAGWDLALLSESVSISSGILTLAAAIRFTTGPSWGRAAVFLAAALWFSMTRPNIFPTLLAWACALMVIGVLRRQILPWVVVAAALVVFSLYGYVYNVRSDPSWRANGTVTRTTVAYAYPVSAYDPVAKAVLADLRKSDAPRCMIPAVPGDVGPHGPTAWVVQTAAGCPGMDAWLTANWSRWWERWLLHHPGQAFQIVQAELPNALSLPIWTGVVAAVPSSVSSLYFGSAPLPQSAVPARSYHNEPLLGWLAAVAVLALLGRARWRGSPWACDLILLASVVGSSVSVISSTLLIQASGSEVGRESAGLAVVLTASCLALVGFGLDRVSRVGPTIHADSEGARDGPELPLAEAAGHAGSTRASPR
jgi:hypothetical protein